MKEDKLIFIISQPRSGSSMLQQILNSHPSIDSMPEPWFMLSLIGTYKETEIRNEYNPHFAQVNFMRYLEESGYGLDHFRGEIARLALNLYEKGRKNEQAFFVDKTTRYYHIIKELKEIFPNSRYIILTRNPVSVFASLIELYGDRVYEEHDRYYDVMLAPKILAEQIRKGDANSIPVKYEDLVNEMDKTTRELGAFLQLDEQLSANYELKNEFATTTAVDPKSVANHSSPVTNYLDAWKKTINNSKRKNMVLDYLDMLGEETVSGLGYSFSEIKDAVHQHKVKRSNFNPPLRYLMADQFLGRKDKVLIRFYHIFAG